MRYSDVVFLDVEDVDIEHACRLREDGGADGLRDAGLLQSAVMRPRSYGFGEVQYPSLATMAAVFIVGIAKNHAFIDGNKRTALACGLAFLRVNGVSVDVGDDWIGLMERVAIGKCGIDEVAKALVSLMGKDVMVEPDE